MKKPSAINDISLQNYCFKKKQKISFGIPDGKKSSGLTVIVGANGTGKSTIIKALAGYIDPIEYNTDSKLSGLTNIKVTYNGEIYKSRIDKKKSAIEWNQVGDSNKSFFLFKMLTNHYLVNHSILVVANDGDTVSDCYDDRRINNLYMRPRLLKSNINITNKNFKSSLLLNEILEYIAQDKDLYKEFKKITKNIIPNFGSIRVGYMDDEDISNDGYFDENSPQEFEKGSIYYDYEPLVGESYGLRGLSKGELSAVKIIANIILAAHQLKPLIIDEPESSLHSPVKKSLAKFISDRSAHQQIIICTHSPYFVNWQDFLDGAKFVRTNKDAENGCYISTLKSDYKKKKSYAKFIKTHIEGHKNPFLLDIVAKEIFFSDKVLLVEGQEDVGILNNWLRERYKEKIIPFTIFGYGIDGATNAVKFIKLAEDLEIKKVALILDAESESSQKFEYECEAYKCNCDKCINYNLNIKQKAKREEDIEDLKKYLENTKYLLKFLPTPDIRNKNEIIFCNSCNRIKGRKEVKGVFDENGNIKENHIDYMNNLFNELDKYFA